MSENLKKFLELLSKDKDLEAKALACNDLGEEKGRLALLELAKENGIELTLADLAKKAENGELSDDELDAVAGGGGCGCPAVGVGGGRDSKDGNAYHCACGAYGQGGDGRANDSNCLCIGAGGGNDEWQMYK